LAISSDRADTSTPTRRRNWRSARTARSSFRLLLRFLLLVLGHEAGQRLAVQPRLTHEVAASDLLAPRVRRQPVAALRQQFLQFVVVDEVVLAGVEDRDEDVQVRQQRLQRRDGPQRDGVVRAVAPLGETLVERMARRFDGVPQRLEDFVQEALAAAHGEGVEACLQRDRGGHEVGAVLALAVERRAEHLGDGDAEERRRDVGPVVDVGSQREALLAARQADGVDLQQQAGGAALLGGFGVEDVGRAESEVEGLEPVGALVEQVAEVGRRPVGGGDGQEHEQPSGLEGRTQRGRGRFGGHPVVAPYSPLTPASTLFHILASLWPS
jgi:hypothetical protein